METQTTSPGNDPTAAWPNALIWCAGIGTSTYAIKQAGFNCVGALDYADIPRLSYEKNFPETKFLQKSLREIMAKFLYEYFNLSKREIDFLQISSPCTGWSCSGSFLPDHVDNELYLVAMYLALQLRRKVKVILFENVPSMLWEKMQIAFSIIGHFFNKFRQYYNVEACVLSSNSYGDSQERKRLFIMCVRIDIGECRWPNPDPNLKPACIQDVLPHVEYLVNRNFGERTYDGSQAAPTITGHADITIGTGGTERSIYSPELAALMGLGKDFQLVGTEQEKTLGLGNGIPVGMMRALASCIRHHILGYPLLEGEIDHGYFISPIEPEEGSKPPKRPNRKKINSDTVGTGISSSPPIATVNEPSILTGSVVAIPVQEENVSKDTPKSEDSPAPVVTREGNTGIRFPADLIDSVEKASVYSEQRAKQFGEVFTPTALAKEMVDSMPASAWGNPDKTILDPCAGRGIFPAILVTRYMEGLKDLFPDEQKRYKHIIEKIIYMAELQVDNALIIDRIFNPDKTLRLNLYVGDTLSMPENFFDMPYEERMIQYPQNCIATLAQ